jgi:hypothetical protein
MAAVCSGINHERFAAEVCRYAIAAAAEGCPRDEYDSSATLGREPVHESGRLLLESAAQVPQHEQVELQWLARPGRESRQL